QRIERLPVRSRALSTGAILITSGRVTTMLRTVVTRSPDDLADRHEQIALMPVAPLGARQRRERVAQYAARRPILQEVEGVLGADRELGDDFEPGGLVIL